VVDTGEGKCVHPEAASSAGSQQVGYRVFKKS